MNLISNISKSFLAVYLWIVVLPLSAQEIQYPYPVKFIILNEERKSVRMAYMDIPASQPNGNSILLLHGKNFNGYYWKDVIPFLSNLGYRVIVPDQIGFGESDRPDIHYSFSGMSVNTKNLLDSLKINRVVIIGHSMGGMLAIRFALMFPEKVDKLILENPIGFEDYRTFVPYTSLDCLYKKEASATYESYKKYQQTYYPEWKPEYEPLVQAQAKDLNKPNFKEIAWANALTYQMIYEQPVCYELKNLTVKTLLIIGMVDRTIVGKDRVPREIVNEHGQYQLLGKQVHEQIKESTLIELPGVGHIPHIQELDNFKKCVAKFLN